MNKIILLQKVVGILLLACCVLVVLIVGASATSEADKDCSFLVFIVPLAIVLLFSKKELIQK